MSAADQLSGKKVLIVEDDAFLHTLLSGKMMELRNRGVEVIPTMNAEEALKVTQDIIPDLMLIDIAMPGKNGFELLEELRTDDRLKQVPVIFLTNLNQDADKKRAQELGALQYFVKADFSLDDISKEIIKALGVGE